MAYKRKGRTSYRLHFSDPEFEGLEVLCGPASTEIYLTVARLQNVTEKDPDIAERVVALLTAFAGTPKGMEPYVPGVLREWNLVDENDRPVPATYEGLAAQELPFVQTVTRAWVHAVVQVKPPLAPKSSDGEVSEDQLPMEELSPSQLS